jgi:hypothetical protein
MKSLAASIELASGLGTVTSRPISQWLLSGSQDKKMPELLRCRGGPTYTDKFEFQSQERQNEERSSKPSERMSL